VEAATGPSVSYIFPGCMTPHLNTVSSKTYRCYSSVPGCCPLLPAARWTSATTGEEARSSSLPLILKQRGITINLKFLIQFHGNQYSSSSKYSVYFDHQFTEIRLFHSVHTEVAKSIWIRKGQSDA